MPQFHTLWTHIELRGPDEAGPPLQIGSPRPGGKGPPVPHRGTHL